MDDISGLWENFSLHDTEDAPFDFGPSEVDNQFYLAARFMTSRVLNIESIVQTFRPLWRTFKGFSARDMGNNMIVFAFEDEADMARVLQSEPWSYDKHLVSFQRVEADTAIEEMECRYASFWVQMYNLPVRRMNKESVAALAGNLGMVEQVSESDGERGREGCMRARVRLDILKPLCRGQKARRADGTELWISFKSERLPNYCYWCGRLTHAEKECELWLRSKGTFRRETQQYGAWLRAPMDKPIWRVEVRVEGRSNVPRWGQPQPQTTSSPTVEPPLVGANGDAQTGKVWPNMGLDMSKENSAQNPDLVRSSVDNIEQHLQDIDLALKTPPTISGLSGFEVVDQPTPVEHSNSDNSQDPVINAAVDFHAYQKQSKGERGSRVVLEDITSRGLQHEGPTQENKQKKKCPVEPVSKAHLSSTDKENITAQTPYGLDSSGLHEVDVQGESRGKWKRSKRTNEQPRHPGVLSYLSGSKRGGSWSEGDGDDDNYVKKGRSNACYSKQNVDGDLAAAEAQPRRTQ
jgi:hypothetical protein